MLLKSVEPDLDGRVAKSRRTGLLLLAALLLGFLLGACGILGYVWFAKEPVRIAGYAVSGPNCHRLVVTSRLDSFSPANGSADVTSQPSRGETINPPGSARIFFLGSGGARSTTPVVVGNRI